MRPIFLILYFSAKSYVSIPKNASFSFAHAALASFASAKVRASCDIAKCFCEKIQQNKWQRLAKDGLPLKAQYFTAQEKSERFFRLFQRADCKHTQKHIQRMGKPRVFARKLLKNIKGAEEWMQMRGNAVGKYIKGGTRMELI